MFITDLSILTRYSRTFFERRLRDINIGFNEQLILQYLYKCENVNQDTIAKHFMLDKGSIAKTLNKLEKKNLINRLDNPNNKREKLIIITKDAKKIMGQVGEELQIWHEYLFEGITKEEIAEFNRILSKMSANAVKVIDGRSMINEDKKTG